MTTRADLAVDPLLAQFVESELLPGLDVSADQFWRGLAELVAELGPRLHTLLGRRDELQGLIDAWYRDNKTAALDVGAEEAFLKAIGYLVPEPGPFSVTIDYVDPEFSQTPGPQLVVPITNARYALNAANASSSAPVSFKTMLMLLRLSATPLWNRVTAGLASARVCSIARAAWYDASASAGLPV